MPKEFAVCAICEQNIRDVLTAIIVNPEGSAAHFDCIIKKISGEEDLRNREKICYLGGGEFGVVKLHPSDPKRFAIRKRIKFELKEHNPDWRRQISDGLALRR